MNKILFYTMSLSSGGAERVIANLANEFVKNNEVGISTLINKNIDYKLDKKIRIIESSNHKSTNLKSRLKNIKRLYKNTLEYKPDVIIAFCPTMCFISGFLRIFSRKFRKIKLIMSERNDPNNKYPSFFSKKLADFFYKRADIVVFQNKDARSFFSKKVQKKGVIIPNPINEKFLNCNINVKKENSIVNVGRLETQKNQELLIRACSELFKKYPNWKLKIYGEGSLKTELTGLIKDLNMENNIFLMGRCNELEKELPKNKIFVLSSNYEGMPNALMEAMVCGLTCISTDCPCGGPNEIIKNGQNGLLIPINNLELLSNTIELLIKNEKLQSKLCKNAITIGQNYRVDLIVKKWINIL